jgi:hypothetical protein
LREVNHLTRLAQNRFASQKLVRLGCR